MIKYFSSIVSILFALCFVSCDKVPNNGDLDDMWQLMSIEKDGTVTNTKEQQLYWSIRANLVQLYYVEDGMRLFGHFKRTGSEMVIYDLCHESQHRNENDNDEWISYDERDILAKWGIFPERDSEHAERLKQTYKIELLNSGSMILSSGNIKLILRKF